MEILHYITPYGTPCSHELDVTDYMSLLEGKIAFRLNNATLDNGYLYNLKFKYRAGTPAHKYSSVSVLWQKDYPFGDPTNLQPVEALKVDYPGNAVASKIKLVSSGHGWGDNNTDNAAEFHDDTHHLWVNGNETFTQHNWKTCNPNPDGCQPQAGTWYYARAGWCPGSIAPWFDYDMTPFLGAGQVDLGYIFDENYKDLCHPHNPNCTSGVTCPDCNDGFNPFLDVACNLITFADAPLGSTVVTGTDGTLHNPELSFSVYPNPSADGLFNFVLKEMTSEWLDVKVFDAVGRQVDGFYEKNSPVGVRYLRLNTQPNGMYFMVVRTPEGTFSKPLIKG